MSYATERSAIEARWLAVWGASPVTAYGKQPFNPPATSWARLTIKDGEGNQIELGGTGTEMHRYAGVVIIEIYVPGGNGAEHTLRGLVDTACGVFRRWASTSPQILFRTPYVADEGMADPPWIKATIHCPFQRDEFH
jgi:hypothetical protein